jgi:hypothetical protein
VVLDYVRGDTNEIIKSLKRSFDEFRDKYDFLIEQWFGVFDCDANGSSLDTKLAASIIRLQQIVYSYIETLEDSNDIISFAWKLVRKEAMLDMRLRPILGSRFADRLYQLVRDLGHSMRTHYTMIRAAVTNGAFERVEVRLGSPRTMTRKVVTNPSKTSPIHEQLKFFHTQQLSSPPHTSDSAYDNIVNVVRPYLSQEDRRLSIAKLQPAAKQATALFVSLVLCNRRVSVDSLTYYFFGFVACANSNEELTLANHYRNLLQTAHDPPVIFNKLTKALKHNTLSGLLRNTTIPDFSTSHPLIHNFLLTPLMERPSVYRLIQFLRDPTNDEPPPCLKRDYGFQFCTQREHVQALRELYFKVLDKTGPKLLHEACVHGGLLRLAVKTLGHVESDLHRFLTNGDGVEGLGFDNDEGLDRFMGVLFKKSRRG